MEAAISVMAVAVRSVSARCSSSADSVPRDSRPASRGAGHLRGKVAEAGKRGFQARLFADQDQFQPPGGTGLVAVGQGHHRVAERLGALRSCRSCRPWLGPTPHETAVTSACRRQAGHSWLAPPGWRASGTARACASKPTARRDKAALPAQPRIQLRRSGHCPARQSYRLVAHHLPVLQNGRDVGTDPAEMPFLQRFLTIPIQLCGLQVCATSA
jgi:hypothetical protein